jgi:hypothetical protein
MAIDAILSDDVAAPNQSFERLTRRMLKDGYFGEFDPGLLELTPRIADAVQRCVDAGLPAVFVWLYDEPWQCFRRLRDVLGHFLGQDYRMLPDFWAWHVDPKKLETGWGPHVDRARHKCLAPDGSPLSLTCWIPLTEANPLNSCMYVVPAFLDPFYGRPSERNALPKPDSIRAIPAKAGDYLIWNQSVLHWGGSSSEFADAPRISLALEFQRADVEPFNTPLLISTPDFGARLRLVGKQIQQYVPMYGFSEQLVALAKQLQSTAPGAERAPERPGALRSES